MKGATVGLVIAIVTAASLPATAAPADGAEPVLFTLAIGYNGVPVDPAAPWGNIQPLRYADDDAARIYTLGRQLGRSARLLTLFDRETATRRPDLAAAARPPTLPELRKAVAALNQELDAVTAAGGDPAMLLFYSGHGRRQDDGRGGLALHDGELTRETLYDEVLARLHARFIHLVVDACHAEATVRPRDGRAQVVDIPPAEMTAYLSRSTLARFPGVGAIVASSSDAQAHEWNVYQGGVFTHEIVSGLRGGADVDGDRRIEYSEMAAFLGAANRAVSAPQARLRTLVHAPAANPRAALVRLDSAAGAGWVEGRPGFLGAFHIEDERGERLADLRAERGFRVSVLLPAEVALYIRTDVAEATVRLRNGERMDFAALSFAPAAARPRGALDSALRRGLFATAFGPAYYRGYVDNDRDLVPVDLPADPALGDATSSLTASTQAPARGPNLPAWIAFGTAGGLTIAATTFGVLTLDARGDYRDAAFERQADVARDRFTRNRSVTIATASAAVVAAAVGVVVWWLDRRAHGESARR